MELNKDNIKKIMGLIVFTIFVLVAMINIDKVIVGVLFIYDILWPFIVGGAIAFVINVPMRQIEGLLLHNKKDNYKPGFEKFVRLVSLVITLVAIFGVISIVIFVVVPQLATTFISLGSTIQDFMTNLQKSATDIFKGNQDIVTWIDSLSINWDNVIQSAIDFMKNGASDMLSSTIVAVNTIISGVASLFIAFIFAIYVLLQKECLALQIKKVMYACLKDSVVEKMLYLFTLANRTFSRFFAGQCLEALILGSMFFITMSILGFPYAMLVGVLISFTALIPVFGALIGCVVGTFLILVVSPVKALAFIIMFFVLQQIEGNLIYPHVVGGSVGLPAIWVLVAVSLGGSLMGIMGMIIFIPLVSVLYTLFRSWVYKRLEDKELKIE